MIFRKQKGPGSLLRSEEGGDGGRVFYRPPPSAAGAMAKTITSTMQDERRTIELNKVMGLK